jgi:glyoxylase-like metal-dependent hydrolase (beta-lactamase superfamily II)
MGGSETHFGQQFHNNQKKLLRLPRDTVLACGHGPLTTLAQEKDHNPFFAK